MTNEFIIKLINFKFIQDYIIRVNLNKKKIKQILNCHRIYFIIINFHFKYFLYTNTCCLIFFRVVASAFATFIGRIGAFIGISLVGYLIDDYCVPLIALVGTHLASKYIH